MSSLCNDLCQERFLKWPRLSIYFPYYWAENEQMAFEAFIFNYAPVLARVLTQNGRLKNKDAIFVCLNFYATVRCKKALSERQLQRMTRSAARRFFETYRCVGKRCKTLRSAPAMQRTPCNVIFKDKMAARLSNGRFVGKGKQKSTAALLSSKRMNSHKENENSDEIIKTPQNLMEIE